VYGVRDLTGGGGIDGAAVYEETVWVRDDGFGEWGLEDLAEDVGYVGGFGEDCDGCVL